MEDQSRRFDDRINHVESKISGLEAAVQSTSQTIDRLATNTEKQIAHLARTVDKLADNSAARNKTNWGVLLSAGALIMSMVIALGTGFVGKPLSDLTTQVNSEVARNRDSHNEIRSSLTNIKEESNGFHAQVETQIAQLDKSTDHHHERIHRLEDMVDKSDKVGVGLESRLSNLERMIFPDARYRAGKPD